MVRENRRRWLPMAAMCGLVIIGTGRLYGQVSTGVGIHKHALGYTTALGSSEVGKIYVPSRYGGVLTLKGNAKLYYTNGADLTTDVATQIYSGALESALVAQGNYCVFTVPSGQWGWFYFVVPGGTSGISNTFVEAGQASYRPWNGWWWPFVPSSGPTLYDAGGPMQKYDTAYNGSIVIVTPPTPRTTFYSEKLDANPGWTTTGAWAFGTPTGAGGDHGGNDPTSGYTGTNVYGYNLTGGYTNNMTPQYLTTTAINCTNQADVHLKFRRWLCIESSQYDHASVQVSKDGTNWVTAWDFSGATLIETAWSLQEIDISATADNQPTVYIRWVMGPTDVGWTYGGWNIDDIELTAGTVQGTVFYQQNLDSNPGWTTTGAWAYGTPTGAGGDHGGNDPKAGYTGTSVYGYNLTGGYANNLTPQYLTTTALNCSGQTGVHLRFRRWLCVESSQYDHASVQVSKDGSTWTTAWDFSGPTLIETAWSLQDIDISSVADNQPAVYIRWVMGPTDVGWTYGGWNIDDIQLVSIPTPTVTTFYSQPLDTNPGWTTTGQWAYGTPTGAGGDHGGADPTSGYTGTSVYGYNLTGGYANNLTPQYLTTAALDCSGQTGVHLRFRRWLCVESSQYDHASVQVSKDGSTWTTAWDFSGPTLIETAWSLQDIDISSVADNQPAVYIRWVMGPTDVGWTYGGWNIDDVELTSGNPSSPPPQQLPKTYAQSWEKSNEGSGQYWFGHCWGWSIAAILIPLPQATTKYGVSFTRDDMKGLYTELCDDQPYSDPSLSISFIPATSPTTALGQDVDAYCDELYRILRISIREDKVPVQSDMRAIATPPNNANEVWNQSIYKYSTNVREVPGAGNERLVEMDMNVYSNFGPWPPPTDYTNDRNEEFVYRLEFDAQGQVIANSPNQNWVSASHYPPHDLYRLTGSPYAAPNPYITKTLIDGLYQP